MFSSIIGKGGFGTVYDIGNGMAMKMSNNPVVCGELDFEFKRHQKVYEAWKEKITTAEKRYISIPEPKIFKILPNNYCMYSMERIYSPIESGEKIWQLWLGENKDYFHVDTYRGIFTGVDGLKSLGVDLERIAGNIGTLASLIHFGAKLTGVDVEYVLGRKKDQTTLKVFVIDFDRSEPWEGETPVDILAESLIIPPIIPDELQDPTLYEAFKTAYISTAKRMHKGIEASKVLSSVFQSSTLSI